MRGACFYIVINSNPGRLLGHIEARRERTVNQYAIEFLVLRELSGSMNGLDMWLFMLPDLMMH